MKFKQIKNRELHRIVSTAIIYRKGKFLIIRRSLDKKVWPGKWTVPGGGLEIDDYINTISTTKHTWYYALANSLKREIEEEVGLEIGKTSYLLDLTFIRPDNIPVLTLSFYAPWKRRSVKLNNESMDYKWISAKDVAKFDLIEGIGTEIEMVDTTLKGKNPDKIKFVK